MFLFPKIIAEKKSPHNGLIKVYKLRGKHSISVDNLTQSGGLLIPIWRRGLKEVKSQKSKVKSCLILGLGGGTAAKEVAKNWPGVKITAIEIDTIMVELGKKYMGLDQIKNLKIIIGDAFKIITRRYQLDALPRRQASSRYDLILVDMYQGKNYPEKAKSSQFFKSLKKLLATKGMVIFNRLNWEKNDQDIADHIADLKKYFSQVTDRKILSNTLVFCSNSK